MKKLLARLGLATVLTVTASHGRRVSRPGRRRTATTV